MLRCRAAISAAILSVLAVVAVATPSRADTGPVFVVPSRPGIPVIINGYDASYAVVEGDWGLARPGHGTVTVYGGHPVLPSSVYSPRNSYHPRYGRPPPRGRYEVEPPADRLLPEPAESFSRNWSTSSDMQPADVPPTPLQRMQPLDDQLDSSRRGVNDRQRFKHRTHRRHHRRHH
jgi:hypothetical protein